MKLTYPVVFADQNTYRSYGVKGIPAYVVIDRQGRVRKTFVGFAEEQAVKIRHEIEAALKQRYP